MRLVFRNGVVIDDPLRNALLFLNNDYSYRSYDMLTVARDATVTLDDIRAANRIGARMSKAESLAVYERRDRFDAALERIDADASLCSRESEIPWDALTELYGAVTGVSGIGLAKLTKFLHKKRPFLIPMLDSVVEAYLRSVSEIPHRSLGFATVATALTRSYKVDLDANYEAIRAVRDELARDDYHLSECRILDIYTWAYAGTLTPAWTGKLPEIPRSFPMPSAGDLDEAARLAADLGIALDDAGVTRGVLIATIREVGYLPARREILRWLKK